MDDFRWIQINLIVIQVLQFTGVTSPYFYITARHGFNVTLPCENMTQKDKCNSTTWLFSGSGKKTPAVPLFEHGKIKEAAKSKSDRLSVTENCSLVIKKVTDEDVGGYNCREFNKGQQSSDFQVHLSVVTITEHKDGDKVTLNCSVRTQGNCRHTVKWLLNGEEVDEDKKKRETSQPTCSANVTIFSSRSIDNSMNYECNVTDNSGKVQQFPFRPQPSVEKTVAWWQITVPVVLGVLISAVAFVIWKRSKEKKTQVDDKLELNSAQFDPETSPATGDPEVGVSYVSINFTKNSKSQIQNKDDESEAVTYSTVKASSSSSAAASTDPSSLYAAIN